MGIPFVGIFNHKFVPHPLDDPMIDEVFPNLTFHIIITGGG
jgi:hypothetical protein